MSRKSKGSNIYNNLKGWEKNYLKRAEQYGHVGEKSTSKQYNKYLKGK